MTQYDGTSYGGTANRIPVFPPSMIPLLFLGMDPHLSLTSCVFLPMAPLECVSS